MTIEEAIKHCEEVAKEKESEAQDLEYSKLDWRHEANQCSECAEEHRQLAEWLKELKSFKKKDGAKAVHHEGDGYADGVMVYDTAFCPDCEHEFEEGSENWECEFCPNCGQRLRWEE